MLEWNAFIKPIAYVVELIFAAVVTISTADKLLFYDPDASKTRCAFGDNIGACASVISLGLLCMMGGIYVLWKRLSSAFLSGMKYRHDTESVMCLLLSLGWLIIAAVITAFRAVPEGLQDGFLRAERRIAITFAWLLWVFHIGSMAIAWFAPDEDNVSEPFEGLNTDAFPVAEAFDLQLETLPPGVTAWPPQPLTDSDSNFTGIGGAAESGAPITPMITDIDRFLEQHDTITDIAGVVADSGSPQTPGTLLDGRASGQPIRRNTIQDVASTWKGVLEADDETQLPEIGIGTPPLARFTSKGMSSERSAPVPTVFRSPPESPPRASLRRRTVRFGDEPPLPR